MFICKYCGKEFERKQQLGGHITFCKENPNIDKNLQKLEENRKHIQYKQYISQKFNCQYCDKEIGNKGCLVLHERHCLENPNRIKCEGNKGKTLGYKAWNVNKTTQTDKRILKGVLTRKNSIATGKYIPIRYKHSDETKRILREKMIDYIKRTNNGKFGQHFSIKACDYIDNLNKEKNWNLQHALDGGEKQVCGYFLDGYDKKLNIAFEYDEAGHYKDVYNNILCDRDIRRQNEIIKELDCEFWRYNEKLNLLYKI